MDKKKCYFSTFIDEVTMTCSPDRKFDEFGFPINICDKISSCNIIKEMNIQEELRRRERMNLGKKHYAVFGQL